MINWIIGGGIIAFTLYIVVRYIQRLRKGQGGCCSGCSQSGQSGCACESKKP